MKKTLIVLLTIITELLLLWVISLLFNFNFIDTAFFDSFALFGLIWCTSLMANRNSNIMNASIRGWTGQDAGGVKPFMFRVSPIILGLIFTVIISLIATLIAYSSYFF